MNSRFTLFTLLFCLSAFAAAQETIVIDDESLVANEDYTWESENTYILNGLVFLEPGATLTIEAGTVIKAYSDSDITTGDNASALIVARGAQIFANGTADAPIIFTSNLDDLEDPMDLTNPDGSVRKGLWGGVIILGAAPIAFSAATNNIEGIVASDTRSNYGGTDPEDNSGVLTYVSIRHGGFALDGDNEINGLTLGGVGSGTTIDYVEVFANLDDGIEWFGGTVRVDHAAVSYCSDDGMDYDTGWRGGGQYWFVLQAPNEVLGTGRAGEHDGAVPDGQSPFSQPTIYNATYIGIGNGETTDAGENSEDDPPFAILLRDNAGGYYYNSIFTDYNGAAIAIEQRSDNTPDSYDRLIAGDLAFRNNIFYNFEAGTEASDLFVAIDDATEIIEGAATDTVAARFLAAGNQIINPNLNSEGEDRDDNGGNIDPRPSPFGFAATGAPAAIAGYDTVAYYGAFAPGNGMDSMSWLTGWTALDEMMIVISDFTNGVGQVVENGFLLDAPVPNPASQMTRIGFELPSAARVTLTVMDIYGRPVSRSVAEYTAGPQSETIDVSRLASGTYFVILDVPGSRLVQRMAVTR
ncbi:T9SS type A sorting domain-containing protein [Lewinella sp. IMCC34191]|uniref:T9SS type A sorting domain-containing protein n=1 Tax=Lewinella sp. IMCC34191 TaxID=2259172 RepID=UPI001E5BA454|nr:T9SS type A sorting domain-containing protein [Lewinella sp. IMCC34191]